MEAVFFYSKHVDKNIKEIIKTDEFMRISYTFKDANTLDSIKNNPFIYEGNFLYIQANQYEIKLLEEKFKSLTDIERLHGQEEKTIIEDIKKQEENAASGMGLVFG